NELNQTREGLRALIHLLPLPVSVQPEGTVSCPLPLPQSGLGYCFSGHSMSFKPLKAVFERTLER
ncbi:hypothetical protein, partial [Thermococcus sp.]|uniref:hypothetical protein n=1 Tax=Thermococcus sp. TaxID=35749 RepID=UPI00261C89DC